MISRIKKFSFLSFVLISALTLSQFTYVQADNLHQLIKGSEVTDRCSIQYNIVDTIVKPERTKKFDLVLVFDDSASMEGILETVKLSLEQSLDMLNPDLDKAMLVPFDTTVRADKATPLTNDINMVKNAIGNITAQGGTATALALNSALNMYKASGGKLENNKDVLFMLVTDGFPTYDANGNGDGMTIETSYMDQVGTAISNIKNQGYKFSCALWKDTSFLTEIYGASNYNIYNSYFKNTVSPLVSANGFYADFDSQTRTIDEYTNVIKSVIATTIQEDASVKEMINSNFHYVEGSAKVLDQAGNIVQVPYPNEAPNVGNDNSFNWALDALVSGTYKVQFTVESNVRMSSGSITIIDDGGKIITAAGTSTLSKLNDDSYVQPAACYNLKINKVDSDDNSKKLAGATFDVVNSSGQIVQTVQTNDEGFVTVNNLPGGNYVLVEKAAPIGYTISTVPVSFVVQEGTVATEVTVKNSLTPAKKPTPTIDPLKPGDTCVSGTGTPGDTIDLTLPDKSVIKGILIDDNGKWNTCFETPLKPKEEVKAIETTPDGVKSDEVVAVVPDDTKPTPTIDQPKAGDKCVSGTGTPGDTIDLTLPDGSVIKDILVDENGKWNTCFETPLKPGEEVKAVEKTPYGTKSDEVSKKVPDEGTPMPTIDQPKAGDKCVSGTGTPGDTIDLTLPDGSVVKDILVDENGKWNTCFETPLKPGEEVKAVEKTPYGTKSDEVSKKVPDECTLVPTIDQPKAGDKCVSGTGTPGNKIELTLPDESKVTDILVDESGKWNTCFETPLKPGDEVKAVEETPYGKKSDEVSKKVPDVTNVPNVSNIYKIYGQVTGPDNKAIENAQVSVNGTTVLTDNLGYYAIDNLAKGNYIVSAYKNGYENVTKSVSITSEDVKQDFCLNLLSYGLPTTGEKTIFDFIFSK
ncbi:MAG: Ig-like domain-containing protein [Oscillospiraceae bacterium]|nr:Ig-like domain-containing protein [Oscillospiraceae bacterium]